VTKPELGTKRTCPETGKNFYDLNKNPIVSPYTGEQYPLSFFEVEVEQKKPKPEVKKPEEPPKEEAVVEDDDDETDEGGPEIISLEEVDEGDDADDGDGDDGDDEAIADIPEVEVELDEDDDDDAKPDDDTFLEEEDEDTDLSDVIGTKVGDEKDDL